MPVSGTEPACHARLGRRPAQSAPVVLGCPGLEVRLAGRDIELVVENQANDTYRIVGAASIVAKVTRDRPRALGVASITWSCAPADAVDTRSRSSPRGFVGPRVR